MCSLLTFHRYGNLQDAIQYAVERENGDIVTM